MSSLFRRVIPCALLLAAGLPAGSAGATGWVTGPALSPPERVATTPLVGLTPSGDRIVAWTRLRREGSNATTEGISVRTAAAAGDFGPAQLLGGANVSDPSLTTSTDESAAIVWVAGTQLHIARRAPGQSTFTEATPFQLGAARSAPPTVALAGGDVFVAVATRDRIGTSVKSAIRVLRLATGATSIEALPGTGTGGALDAASHESNAPEHVVDGPSVAVGADTIHVAWDDRRDSTGAAMNSLTAVRRATRPLAGGVFTAPIAVDNVTSQSFRAPATSPTAVAAEDRVALAWSRSDRNQVATLDVSAGGTVEAISTTRSPFVLRAGLDRTGALTVGWMEFAPNESVWGAFGAVVPPGGPAGPATRLTPPNANQTLDDVVVGPDGSSVALANRRQDSTTDSADARVLASFRAPGAPFGDLEDVSGPQTRTSEGAFDSAAGAIGADGRTVVAWTADEAGRDRFYLSERDAAPPAIGALSVPATATAETPVALDASASDALSPVAVAWDLGDGSQRRGESVTHAYGAPGDYTVTVTARDGAGNVATQARTIAVAPQATGGLPIEPRGPDTAEPDRSLPVVSDLKSARRRFRVGPQATTLLAAGSRTPSGTVFNLKLDERATLVFTFSGRVAGRRAGTRCVAGRRAGRRCTAAVRPGTFIRTARGPGALAVPFSGRIDRTPLAPGSYVASITAIDAAGNRSRPATARFTVVPR